MASETRIQEFVHKLEEGGWAKWLRRALLWAAIAYVINLWMFRDAGFRGLSHEKGIEQAQISRELARGNGFSTKMIRPAALWQFHTRKGAFPLETTPDTYHAPLNPWIGSIAFRVCDAVNDSMRSIGNAMKTSRIRPIQSLSGLPLSVVYEREMDSKVVIYPYDKIVAGVQLTFFLAAVLMSYLTAKRLFDKKLALLGMGLLLLCQRFWDFAFSGLPQMLLLFLFSSMAYVMVRAIEARYAGKSTLWWCVGLGALFGLLALAHGLTIFLFAGALFFAGFFFQPRLRDAAVMLGVFLLLYSPWLVRNHQVCGNPLGVGWYSGLFQIRGSESQVMRTMALEGPLSGVNPTIFGEKVRGQAIAQLASIYDHLGHILVAPLFFLALLHLFKRPETSAFRWCIISMWVFGFVGMCTYGIGGESHPVAERANDLHVLFVPLMTFYGFAFVMVMWMRLEINIRLIRISFIVLIYLISALPFLSQFIELQGAPKSRVQWPPYVAPFIAILNSWTIEREVIMSDMPWAVAWYADRKSLWLPMTQEDFTKLNDYNLLGGRIVGLYLTPVSGGRGFLNEIIKGEYKEWAPFIIRQVNVKDFPLRAVTALPIDNECVFYADRDRWSTRED